MERCSSGHMYDREKDPFCPYCVDIQNDLEKTQPVEQAVGQEQPDTRNEDKAIGAGYSKNEDSDKTIAFWKEKTGIDPVVGWLVCVEGADKGRDYRIRMGQNTLGRGDNVDISIKGDNTISGKTSAARVIYEPTDGEFVLIPGQGRALTYLNNSGIYMPTPLSAFDRIRLGKTELLFVPFCGDEFSWDLSEENTGV
jgi:hypothetical protein